MSVITSSRATFGRLSTIQKTVDLPGFSDIPAEIDLSESEIASAVNMYIASDFYITLAETASKGLTRIANDSTRCKYPSGMYQFPIVGLDDKLYIRLQAGSTETDGISYWFIESD